MRTLILILLTACNIQNPDGSTTLIAAPDVERPEGSDGRNTNPLDAYSCLSLEENLSIDIRTAFKHYHYFEPGNVSNNYPVTTDIEFYKTHDQSDIDVLASLFTIEYTVSPRTKEMACEGDNTLNPTGVERPTNADIRIITGICQTGVFKHTEDGDVGRILNMADETSFIIVPSAELAPILEAHLRCDNEFYQ